MAHYVDTSALVKLVVAERETRALRRWLRDEERQPVSSDLTRTELMRAVRRGAPARLVAARRVLEGVTTIAPAPSTFDAAGRLEPVTLRSLDAIHLATALELGDDLEAFVGYDDRLLQAAEANGIPVLSPR